MPGILQTVQTPSLAKERDDEGFGKMKVVILEPTDPRLLEESTPLLDRVTMYSYDDSEKEDTIGDSMWNKSLNVNK